MNTNKEILLLVDVDDVLLELVPNWLNLNNKKYGDNVQSSDIKDWFIHKYVKCGKDIYNLLTPEVYDGIEIVKDALDGVNKLRKFGRVAFATTPSEETMGIKYKILKDNGFIENKKDYIEISDKSLLRCNYIIDDNIDNVLAQNALGATGILFDRQWNKSFGYKNRALNWKDLIEKMEGDYFTNVKLETA